MKIRYTLFLMAFLAIAMLLTTGCGEDEAEDAIAAAAGIDELDLGCNEVDVPVPDKWSCLAVAKLGDEKQAEMMAQGFEVPLGPVSDILSDVKFVLVAAKMNDVEGESRLRFANKLKIDGDNLILDGETVEKLGDSVGPDGTGWYALLYADEDFGFVSGEVADCDGNKKAGILVTASSSPFYTSTAGNGSWAVPALGGSSVTTNFQDGDCTGSTSDPLPTSDGEEDTNPKCDGDNNLDPDSGECVPPSDDFSDDTTNIDAGDDEMGDPEPEAPAAVAAIDFEDGDLQGFSSAACVGVDGTGYGTFFPDGGEQQYMYMTTGGNQAKTCTSTVALTVPEGATKLVISYDFASQEYAEWVGSAYNDLFTAIIQGEYDYIINRSVNNIALSDDWSDLSGDAALAAGVADSADAQYNATGAVLDGHLKYGSGEGDTPRGSAEDNSLGQVAEFPVTAGEDIVLILTISDVADAIYDSVAVIDWVAFE